MLNPEAIAALPVFVGSFLGSAHCVGMCGGFVALYTQSSHARLVPHILYNFGRLITYLTLGIAATTLGRQIDALSGVARASSVIVAVWLMVFGCVALVGKGDRLFTSFHTRLGRMLAPVLRPVFNSDGMLKPFFIGAITTLLPCGWLYAFVAVAAATADIPSAILIMVCFWLGTLPAMFGFGLASRYVTRALGARMPRITALLLILSGILCLNFHFAHSHHHEHHPQTSQSPVSSE